VKGVFRKVNLSIVKGKRRNCIEFFIRRGIAAKKGKYRDFSGGFFG